MKNTNYLENLEPGEMYHIYNRGINRTDIFYRPENYPYFLSKFALYLSNLVDTFAYCLLGNHFHLLVRIKENDNKIENLTDLEDPSGLITKKEGMGLHHPDKLVSKKFSDFFNSYTKSINKMIGRTGGLFETPFKRIKIDNAAYFSQVMVYIHFNPQKHGFVDDFRDYKHSSYHSHLSLKSSKLMRTEVLNWFGNAKEYIDFHEAAANDSTQLNNYVIEID